MRIAKFLPPAARGALFEKTAPLDPPQKLFIKSGHRLQPESTFGQTMTAFGLFKVSWFGGFGTVICHLIFVIKK
jgi:hypothetical protein